MPTLRRLKTRCQFLEVAAAGHKWVTPGLILQARLRGAERQARNERVATDVDPDIGIGFTVSRRVGNAVRRNRAKRRLRALAGEILLRCGQPGHDYVLIGRKETPTREFSELRQDLCQALKAMDRGRSRRQPGGKERETPKLGKGRS